MNNRRELTSGLLAALVSIIIIVGSFAISFAEDRMGISQAILPTASPTSTITPTVIIPTPKPGEPTLTASPTQLSPTPTTPTPTPSCTFPEDWVPIVVNQGQTLEYLAEAYQISPEDLMVGNCLLIASVSPGSILYVPDKPLDTLTPTMTFTPYPTEILCAGHPSSWVLYTVRYGDTLYSLSVAYGVSVLDLQAANCMGSSTNIYIGLTLWVPNVTPNTPIPSITPSSTATVTPSATSTPTATFTPSLTTTSLPTSTPSSTSTPGPTNTPTPTHTNTTEPTPTSTDTTLPTDTATPEPTPTSTNTSEPYPYP